MPDLLAPALSRATNSIRSICKMGTSMVKEGLPPVAAYTFATHSRPLDIVACLDVVSRFYINDGHLVKPTLGSYGCS